MIENTEERRIELAREAADCMTLNNLVDFFVEYMVSMYEEYGDRFQQDWKTYKGTTEETEDAHGS